MDKFESLFQRGGLSLDRLRNFASIAASGGLSRAAEGDPARMSLFSKQVKELEGFFGVPLTRRQGRSVVLTDAGRRLAQLAQESLLGLEDFQRTSREVPHTLTIAASNSVLEWQVLPHAGELRRSLPNTLLSFQSARTRDLAARLVDMTIDLAILREDVVTAPLKFKRLGRLTYSLFLPRRFNLPRSADKWREALAGVPLATSTGGQFREQLEDAASKAKWPLRIELSCNSFTQAARTVKTSEFGAILPSIAAVDFDRDEVEEVSLPFLRFCSRSMCLAWNPRLVEVRSTVRQAVDAFPALLTRIPSQ